MLHILCFFAIVTSALASDTPTPQSGYYRFLVGQIQVTALSDGTSPYPMDQLLTGTTPDAVDATLAESFLKEPYQTSVNCFLLDVGGRLALIDTGGGAFLGPTLNKLVHNIQAAGYQPEQIDDVFLTHMHVDHEGGLVNGTDRVFPKATLHVNEADRKYWLDPAQKKAAAAALQANASDGRAKFMASNFDNTAKSVQPYIDAGRLKPFHDGDEVLPGIHAVAAHGHTPGHTLFRVESSGETLLIWGDIVHVAEVQLGNPAVTILFDSVPADAAAERKKILAQCVSNGTLIAGAHIPFPGVGHLRASSVGYTWIPVDYNISHPAAPVK